jgi:NADPH:quinone reductase-like Zn-dependent oxidoreductase
VSPNQKDLLFMKELVEAGKGKPVIERRYALTEVAEALRHVGYGLRRGQTVIQIIGDAPVSRLRLARA